MRETWRCAAAFSSSRRLSTALRRALSRSSRRSAYSAFCAVRFSCCTCFHPHARSQSQCQRQRQSRRQRQRAAEAAKALSRSRVRGKVLVVCWEGGGTSRWWRSRHSRYLSASSFIFRTAAALLCLCELISSCSVRILSCHHPQHTSDPHAPQLTRQHTATHVSIPNPQHFPPQHGICRHGQNPDGVPTGQRTEVSVERQGTGTWSRSRCLTQRE